MKRLVIMTIGKTHSGKSTFAKLLEKHLPHSVVLDQDNQATFINTYYQKLKPSSGPNLFKFGLSQYILDYTLQQTEFHIILCNSNLAKRDRCNLLNYYFKKEHFIRILIAFQVNDDVLLKRVKESTRSTEIFRNPSLSFEQLLNSQQNQIELPTMDEADYIFTVDEDTDQQELIQNILQITYEELYT